VLRPDSETDFLGFSLPDAIASSLAGLRSLGVRSTAGAARLVSGELDFARIAAEAHVDLVMTGTLLRAGDAIRVTTQLVGAPGGEVLWSHSAHATLRDVFQLHDDLVQRIVSSLSLPLTAREQQLLRHDVPANRRPTSSTCARTRCSSRRRWHRSMLRASRVISICKASRPIHSTLERGLTSVDAIGCSASRAATMPTNN
jgi:TolB-like protein